MPPRAMTRIAVLLWVFVATTVVKANNAPSDRLMNSAFADHFTRFICVSKYPEMKPEIQQAFDSSPFRFIGIHCRALKCSDPEQSKGMQILLERSKQFSDAENRKTCSSYRESLRASEEEFGPELMALYPKSGKARSSTVTHN
jgi:hypothetical protein